MTSDSTKPRLRLKFKDEPGGSQLQRTPPNTPAVSVTGTARCGHQDEKIGPPQFRSAMLANIATRDCSACRKARQESEQAAAKARREDPVWIAEQGAKKQRKKEAKKVPRLPDGARFAATYDAASMTWTGTLTIGADTILSTFGSVFGLMRQLDRTWRGQQPNTTEPDPVVG